MLEAVRGSRASVKYIQSLINAGTDVNAKDSFKSVPLFHAAVKANVEAVNMLLKAGARPYEDSDGKTAIDYARSNKNPAILKALMEAIDVKNAEISNI